MPTVFTTISKIKIEQNQAKASDNLSFCVERVEPEIGIWSTESSKKVLLGLTAGSAVRVVLDTKS
jgi:hypothetical protein